MIGQSPEFSPTVSEERQLVDALFEEAVAQVAAGPSHRWSSQISESTGELIRRTGDIFFAPELGHIAINISVMGEDRFVSVCDGLKVGKHKTYEAMHWRIPDSPNKPVPFFIVVEEGGTRPMLGGEIEEMLRLIKTRGHR